MWYAVPGILALLVIFIINFDVLTKSKKYKHNIPAIGAYRLFIFSLLAFFLIDALWGIGSEIKNLLFLQIVTINYFLALAFVIFAWTRFVTKYIARGKIFRYVLNGFGYIFMSIVGTALVINIFTPIVFSFDENIVYQAGILRYVLMGIQLLLFAFTAIYSFVATLKKEVPEGAKHRYVTIGASTFTMIIIALVQLFYPLLPVYTIAFLIATCLIHTFVLQGEIQEHQDEIEGALSREQKQKEELISAKLKAYTDALTGVKSMFAYIEMQKSVDERIDNGTLERFGIVVFDLNDLKVVNDTTGHESGDEFIINASKLICVTFKRSPVYRVGGDEFVAIIEGDDFDNRDKLLKQFNDAVENNLAKGNNVVVASGVGVFDKKKDKSFQPIFAKADKAMYERKQKIKEEINVKK